MSREITIPATFEKDDLPSFDGTWYFTRRYLVTGVSKELLWEAAENSGCEGFFTDTIHLLDTSHAQVPRIMKKAFPDLLKGFNGRAPRNLRIRHVKYEGPEDLEDADADGWYTLYGQQDIHDEGQDARKESDVAAIQDLLKYQRGKTVTKERYQIDCPDEFPGNGAITVSEYGTGEIILSLDMYQELMMAPDTVLQLIEKVLSEQLSALKKPFEIKLSIVDVTDDKQYRSYYMALRA